MATIKGPRLVSEIALEFADAEKKLLHFRSEIVGFYEAMKNASKETKASLKDEVNVRKAQIAETKEHMGVLKREAKAARDVANEHKRVSKSVQDSTHSFGTFSKALGTSITLWYTARTAIYAVRNAIEEVADVYKKGVEAIDDFQSSVIGISAIMAPHIATGTTAIEKFNIAAAHNEQMLLKLEAAAARHVSTGKSLIQVYEGLAIAGVFATEDDVENMAKLADFITLYTKGQRLEIQLMQEVRGLMDGQVRAQNKLAYTLDRMLGGNLKAMLKTWKEMGRDQDGSLIILTKINQLLGDIKSAQGKVLSLTSTWLNTWDVVENRILRRGVQGAYEEIRDVLESIVRFFFDIETGDLAAPGIIAVEILRDGWRAIRDVIKGAIGDTRDFSVILHEVAIEFREFIRDADAEQFGKDLRGMFDTAIAGAKIFLSMLTMLFIVRFPVWAARFGKIFLNTIIASMEAGAVGAMGFASGIYYLMHQFEEMLDPAGKATQEFKAMEEAMGEATSLDVRNAWKGLKDAIRGVDDVAASLYDTLRSKVLNAITKFRITMKAIAEGWTPEQYNKTLKAALDALKEDLADTETSIVSVGNQLRKLREYKITKYPFPEFTKAGAIIDPDTQRQIEAWRKKAALMTVEDERHRLDVMRESLEKEKAYYEEQYKGKKELLAAFNLYYQAKLHQIEAMERNHLKKTLQQWAIDTDKKAKVSVSLHEKGIQAVLMEGEVLRISKEEWDDYYATRREAYEIDRSIWSSGYKAKIEELEENLKYEDWLIKNTLEEGTKEYKAHMAKRKALEGSLFSAKVDAALQAAQIVTSSASETFRMLAEQNKKYFKWYQAAAIAEIMVNTAVAIMRVYKDLPFWAAVPASAALAGLAGAQVAAVMKQKPPEGLAEGGVSQSGFSAVAGVYGQPTYVMAEKKGKPEAVVPLDDYLVQKKEEGTSPGITNNYYIMAMDPRSFRDFAKRNPAVFREQFVTAVQSNDPQVKNAVKVAAR